MQQVGHVGGKQFCVDRLMEEGDDRFSTCTSAFGTCIQTYTLQKKFL